jgi:hypothetical protein
MYGLVNKAIQGLVSQRKGKDAWKRVTQNANTDASFLSMETYPDEVTLALVGSAAAELDTDAASFLRELGYFWVTYTGSEGYGEMFNMWGQDMRSFLANLDEMHERVKASMPHLEPPSFTTENLEAGKIRLIYRSHRDGMAPMVIGLLEGLAAKFDTPMEIEHSVGRETAGHDEFLLTVDDE